MIFSSRGPRGRARSVFGATRERMLPGEQGVEPRYRAPVLAQRIHRLELHVELRPPRFEQLEYAELHRVVLQQGLFAHPTLCGQDDVLILAGASMRRDNAGSRL